MTKKEALAANNAVYFDDADRCYRYTHDDSRTATDAEIMELIAKRKAISDSTYYKF